MQLKIGYLSFTLNSAHLVVVIRSSSDRQMIAIECETRVNANADYPCGSLSALGPYRFTHSGCAHDSYCPTSGCH